MISISQLGRVSPILLICSMCFSGCTASETMQEKTQKPLMTESLSSVDMLTAGIRTTGSSESSSNNTSLIFFMSNKTEADKKLLIWNTPVEQPLSADVFSVEFNGVDLDYQGRMIKRGLPLPEHFLTIEAGGTLETIVDIANYYDMSMPGSYSVSLDPALIGDTHQFNDKTPVNYVPETLVLTVP